MSIQRLGIKSWQLFFFLAKLIDYLETWKYIQMEVLGALGCINNAHFEKISK